MGISAIVVTYNRVGILKKCLSAMLNQSIQLNFIYVIDNNSSDNTEKYLDKFRNNSRIIVINTHKNLGGAGGFSLGLRKAFNNSNSDYFWVMDDDSMPQPSAVGSLIKTAKKLHNKFGFLCSNVRWWKNNAPCLANVPHVSQDWTKSINKGLVKLTSATFVSLFITRKEIKKVGLPIADMFIWGDDTEYTTRLSRDLDSYLVPNSIVLHNSAKNSTNDSLSKVDIDRIFYYKYEFRNILYISRKYYTFSNTAEIFIDELFNFVKALFCSKNKRLFRSYCALNGIIKGLFFNPKVKFPK